MLSIGDLVTLLGKVREWRNDNLGNTSALMLGDFLMQLGMHDGAAYVCICTHACIYCVLKPISVGLQELLPTKWWRWFLLHIISPNNNPITNQNVIWLFSYNIFGLCYISDSIATSIYTLPLESMYTLCAKTCRKKRFISIYL